MNYYTLTFHDNLNIKRFMCVLLKTNLYHLQYLLNYTLLIYTYSRY